VIPRSRGGTTSWENLVTACRSCNLKKRNRTPEEAGMRLLRKPSPPHHSLLLIADLTIPEIWKAYLP
jgi:5-methylcytosine-specific restriction endonuclease McrA